MALPKLTYEDFKARLSIQEVLQDAGYHLNRRDGLRYPSYVRLGSAGHGALTEIAAFSLLSARTTTSYPSSRDIRISSPTTGRVCLLIVL